MQHQQDDLAALQRLQAETDQARAEDSLASRELRRLQVQLEAAGQAERGRAQAGPGWTSSRSDAPASGAPTLPAAAAPVIPGRPAGLTGDERGGRYVPESDASPPATGDAAPPVPPGGPRVVRCGARGVVDPRLPDQLCALVRGGADPLVVLDVSALPVADLATVDALARLQLLVRGLGAQLRLQAPTPELTALLDLAGLADAVPDADASP